MNRPRMRVAGWGSRVLLIAAVSAVGVFASPITYSGDIDYQYDVHGRLTKRETINPAGDVVTITYGYDSASNRTSVVTTTVDPITPTVPTGLTASVISVNQINLSWSASSDGGGSGLAGYRIRRDGVLLTSVSATNYSDTSVVGSTTYHYTVSAYDGYGNESAQSSAVSASTPDITPPSVPTGLAANPVSPTWVNLSWNASTDTGGSGLAGYEIYRNGSLIDTSPTNGYADQSVSASTAYTYAVKGFDGAGNRSGLSVSAAVTTPDAPDTTPPTVPTNLGISAPSSNTVNFSWSASTDPGPGASGVQGYQVFRGGSYLGTTSATSLSDNSVACGGSYSYQVRAFDFASTPNYSGLSGSVAVTTPDTIGPSTPAIASLIAPATNQVNLSWSTPSDVCSGVQGYRIYRNGSLLNSTTATSYTDTTAAAYQYYTYQVQAYDIAPAHNPSALSSGAGVTVPDTIGPNAPPSVRFENNNTGSSVTVRWDAATDNSSGVPPHGVTSYRISRDGGASWTEVGNTLSAAIGGLARGTAYTVLVQARDDAGNWGQSGSGSFTTPSSYTDSVTLTAGGRGDGWTQPRLYGYIQGSLGSLSPTTLAGGKTIIAYYNQYQSFFDGVGWTDVVNTVLIIEGFSSNPGQGWLSSISVAGTGASATTFACGTTTTRCTWQWVEMSSPNGAITVVHQ